MKALRQCGPRLLTAAALLLLLALVAGCTTNDPQNTLAPSGDVAEKIRDLFNIVLWPLVAIFVVVEGLLVFALFWFRRRRGRDLPKQVHGNLRLEVAWTIVPALFLFVLAIPTIATIIDLAETPEGDVLEVEVTARQWSWSFKYPAYDITTTNEMYIPVGQTVKVRTLSADVIHSFWVPKLAGKVDVIPARRVDGKLVGRVNEMWFNATEPTEMQFDPRWLASDRTVEPRGYSGQCAEFCGLGHWQMTFKVIALPDDEFQQWVRKQQVAAPGSGGRTLTWRPEE